MGDDGGVRSESTSSCSSERERCPRTSSRENGGLADLDAHEKTFSGKGIQPFQLSEKCPANFEPDETHIEPESAMEHVNLKGDLGFSPGSNLNDARDRAYGRPELHPPLEDVSPPLSPRRCEGRARRRWCEDTYIRHDSEIIRGLSPATEGGGITASDTTRWKKEAQAISADGGQEEYCQDRNPKQIGGYDGTLNNAGATGTADNPLHR